MCVCVRHVDHSFRLILCHFLFVVLLTCIIPYTFTVIPYTVTIIPGLQDTPGIPLLPRMKRKREWTGTDRETMLTSYYLVSQSRVLEVRVCVVRYVSFSYLSVVPLLQFLSNSIYIYVLFSSLFFFFFFSFDLCVNDAL